MTNQSRTRLPMRAASARARLLAPMTVAAILAGCAATQPGEATSGGRCVVSVEPGMRMVTLAKPEGLDDGVTSLFFSETPTVRAGDLVEVDDRPGNGGPKLQLLESSSKSCQSVTHSAGHHHGHH